MADIHELTARLRKETGAGVNDCRKALILAELDYDLAKHWMKTAGQAIKYHGKRPYNPLEDPR